MLLSDGTAFIICSVELYCNPVIITVSLPIAGNIYYVSNVLCHMSLLLCWFPSYGYNLQSYFRYAFG
jgi:hypothetical protein